MARVNVDQTALTDPRFSALAKALKLADADHAIGKMVRVWNACQEAGLYHLDGILLDAIFGVDGVGDVLVLCGLCRYAPSSTFYVRGTKGRIEWLKKRRHDGKKGWSST